MYKHSKFVPLDLSGVPIYWSLFNSCLSTAAYHHSLPFFYMIVLSLRPSPVFPTSFNPILSSYACSGSIFWFGRSGKHWRRLQARNRFDSIMPIVDPRGWTNRERSGVCFPQVCHSVVVTLECRHVLRLLHMKESGRSNPSTFKIPSRFDSPANFASRWV